MDNSSGFIKRFKPELFLMLVALYWGLSFPLIKISLTYTSPIFFVFSRFTLCFIIFIIFFRKRLREFKADGLKKGLILGIFLYFGFVSQTIGLKYTTAANSAFITGINIILIPFAQILILKTKPRFENILGIAVAIAGLYFLAEIKEAKINLGDLITLVCSISFAFYIVLLSKYLETTDYLVLVFAQFTVMVVLTLISTFVFEVYIFKDFFLNITPTLITTTIFTAVFSTLLGIFLSIKYQKYVDPVRAGLIYNMEQVFAVIFAFILLGEILNLNQVIGASLLFTGVIVSEFYEKIKSVFRK